MAVNPWTPKRSAAPSPKPASTPSMAGRSGQRPTADPYKPAARPIFLTWLGLIGERLAQALWLPVSLVLLAATLWAFELDVLFSAQALKLLLAAFALALLASLIFGFWGFRWPGRSEAIARLDSSLPGRPLAALADGQKINADDPASAALWQEHRRRMETRARRARALGPKPGLAERDPYALRLVAATAALMAVLFASPIGRSTLSPVATPADAASGSTWEGWIVPPDYTQRPTLYLNEIERAEFEVPQGSRVILRLYGAPGAYAVEQSLNDEAPVSEDDAQAVEFDIRTSGALRIDGPSGRAWDIAVLQDQFPQITAVGRLRRGRSGVTIQSFEASDDYGVTMGEAEIMLDLAEVDRRHGLAIAPEPRETVVLPLPLPITGSRTALEAELQEDFSLHPWAHMPVRIVLRASDGAGQSTSATPITASLPGRRFFEPSARALIELRRDLLWNALNARRSAQLMRAMLHLGDDAFVFDGAPVLIRGAVEFIETRLEAETWSHDARDELAANLWELALLLEEGELANARERLERAQQRLNQAMRDGAAPDEISELMDELREATRDYMRMLAEQAEPADDGGDERDRGEGEAQEITQDQIQEMMDRIQELMNEGRMEEAAELMAQLNALLENLQMQRGEGGDPMPGDPSMEQFGETLDDQQSLADDTFRELQEQFGPNGEARKPDDEAMEELAERQRALREQLREQQLDDVPGEGSQEADEGLEALDEAQRAMEESAEALEEGDLRGALERQAEALDQLREGLRAFRETQTVDNEAESGQDQAQGRGGRRDPLGRDVGEAENNGQAGSTLPGTDTRARARELLDEIRRRSAERERDEDERDYLGRLIERY